jgi:hypothetical protein
VSGAHLSRAGEIAFSDVNKRPLIWQSMDVKRVGDPA